MRLSMLGRVFIEVARLISMPLPLILHSKTFHANCVHHNFEQVT